VARGRMIMSRIAGDKRINDLSDDTSRLAFTWLITFADCEGRTHGDPAMVRSMVFPRREDVSAAQMEDYIVEWAQLGLIVWYEADDDRWIYFPGFKDNQPGLVKTKEAPSRIPAPREVQTESSATPAQVQTESSATPPELKESKVKESESKGKHNTGENNSAFEQSQDGGRESYIQLIRAYQDLGGLIGGYSGDKIREEMASFERAGITAADFQEAKQRAIDNKVDKVFPYAMTILRRWVKDGKDKRAPAHSTGPGFEVVM